MTIKEIIDKNNEIISYYDSSNILMSKYLIAEKKLAIIFSKGHQYIYEGVGTYHFQRFQKSGSQGKGLSNHIIKNYSGVKSEYLLESEQIDAIKKQIKNIIEHGE